MIKNLNNFEGIVKNNSKLNAIFVNDKMYTYLELYTEALTLKNTITNFVKKDELFIGILCYRSINAYSGILGTLFSNHAYLPINPYNPIDKIKRVLDISECKTIILSEECADVCFELLDINNSLLIICPNPGEKIKSLKNKSSKHKFIFPDEFINGNLPIKKKFDLSNPAYMMFTSGSTGDPKGIIVSQKNLLAYCNYTISKYKFKTTDKISQMFDITFDLSVHDIMITFLTGASLYVIPKQHIMSPGEFIKKNMITVWFSVPSVAMFMDRVKGLKKNNFPTLKYSLFCGEGLPSNIAKQWQISAPNSIIDNLYGPTEATIAFMNYRWDNNIDICVNGLVPIGKVFDNLKVKLIDDNKEVLFGEVGELYVSGNQVVEGYYKNEKLSNEKFITFENDDIIWYKTGDLVKQIDKENFTFMGRYDDQLQIRGNRVEMLEIDKVIRDAVGHQMAISVPIFSEYDKSVAEDIIAFVEVDDKSFSKDDILNACKLLLPIYMVPSSIYLIDVMPLNVNGKIDKKALLKIRDDNELLDIEELDVMCSVCMKTLEEDKSLNGFGLIKILNHQGEDDYICHVCLKGF